MTSSRRFVYAAGIGLAAVLAMIVVVAMVAN